MNRYQFSETRSHLTEIVNLVVYGNERAIVTKSGKDVVAIISIEDLERLKAYEDFIDLKTAKKIDKEIKEKGTVKWEDLKKEMRL